MARASSQSFTGELELDLASAAPLELTVDAKGGEPAPSTAFAPTATLVADASASQEDRLSSDDADEALGLDLAHAPAPSSRRGEPPSPPTSRSGELAPAVSTRAPQSTSTTTYSSPRASLALPSTLGILGLALIVIDVAVGPAARWEAARLAWAGIAAAALAVLLFFWRLLDDRST